MNMDKFWSALDLGENMERSLNAVRSMRGLVAMFMACFVAIMMIVTAMFAYRFDILATLNATDVLTVFVIEALPPRFEHWIRWLVLFITIAPTLYELVGSRFAKEGSVPIQAIVLAMCIFDLWTDAPVVTEYLSAQWAFFMQFDIFGYLLYAIAWSLFLFCASFFFEMVTICLGASLLVLLLRSFSGQSSYSMPSMASRIHDIDA